MKDELLHWKKAKNPNYLGSWDFIESVDNNENITYCDRTLTIKEISQEEVTDMEAVKKGKMATKKEWVLHFVENYHPFILHATCNFEAIVQSTGSKFINRWVGKQITFYVKKGVRAFGKNTDAVRVREQVSNTNSVLCPKCGNPVKCISGMTADQTLDYTEKQLGIRACIECGKKYKEEMENKAEDNINE